MQNLAAEYNGEQQERVARDGRDSRVTMMAAVAEDGGCGRQQQWWRMTAADDNSSGQ